MVPLWDLAISLLIHVLKIEGFPAAGAGKIQGIGQGEGGVKPGSAGLVFTGALP